MKKLILIAIAASSLFASCKAKDPAAAEGAPAAGAPAVPAAVSKSDASYAFGVAIGNSLKSTSVEIDYSAFLNGMKDVIENKKQKMTMDEANEKIQAALSDAMSKKAVSSAAEEKKFFDENGKKTGISTTASGLQYEVVKEGGGAKPVATDTVKVDYVGTLLDGTKFDSSVDRGEPAVFPLDRVIPGWTEGIQLMTVGSKYKLYIPSALGYGEQGAGGVIGPNATLVFEVDLLSIEPK